MNLIVLLIRRLVYVSHFMSDFSDAAKLNSIAILIIIIIEAIRTPNLLL